MAPEEEQFQHVMGRPHVMGPCISCHATDRQDMEHQTSICQDMDKPRFSSPSSTWNASHRLWLRLDGRGHVKPTRGDAVRRHGVEAGVDVAPGERNGVCSFFMLDLLIQNLPWPIQKRCFNPCLWEDVDNHPGLQTRSVDRRGVVRRGD